MNLANKITILRILLVPLFMVLLLADFPYSNVLAAMVLLWRPARIVWMVILPEREMRLQSSGNLLTLGR